MDKEDENSLLAAMRATDELASRQAEESRVYWSLHRERFKWTCALALRLARAETKTSNPVESLLDIGNSYQTALLDRLFPSQRLDTLGFLDHRFKTRSSSEHIEYDLNLACDRASWPVLPQAGHRYGMVVFLEVIEHLHTSPLQILLCLRELMPTGGLAIIQTPNAAALKKRVRLLTGKNPFERIRTDPRNPGHFREYTLKELAVYGRLTGFRVEQSDRRTFFADGQRLDRICDRLSTGLPGALRGTLTVVLRKTAETPRVQMDGLPIL